MKNNTLSYLLIVISIVFFSCKKHKETLIPTHNIDTVDNTKPPTPDPPQPDKPKPVPEVLKGFVTRWSIKEENKTVEIFKSEGVELAAYDFIIDWGEGAPEKNVWKHEYKKFDVIYDIKITGTFPGFSFGSNSHPNRQLTTVIHWGDNQWETMEAMFSHCGSLVKFDAIAQPDLSKCTSTKHMFYNAKKFDHPLNDWLVGNVSNMHAMFLNAEKFNQPLNDWDVSKVTNMISMFYMCSTFNQPLDQWKVGSVTNMRDMFAFAKKFDQAINDWEVENVLKYDYFAYKSNLSCTHIPKGFVGKNINCK